MEHKKIKNKTIYANSNQKTYNRTKQIVLTGMFSAILIVLSQTSIPMPSGVPITLQTFAVALTGAVLGWKFGVASTLIYILLGMVGLPVFANFKYGLQALAGPTGGFIYGFLLMVILCGVGGEKKNLIQRLVYGIFGLIGCHGLGINHFAFVSDMSFWESALLVSIPYLIKDVILVIMALLIGDKIKKFMLRENGRF